MVDLTSDSFSCNAFNFSNCQRNMALYECGKLPAAKLTSTGTTIVATTYKDGVVMGADSRATSGNIIADKHCMKVHKLTQSIYACGAGTAADLDQVSNMVSANLRLQELNTNRSARVITAMRVAKQHLFKYMGYVGAYLLIGGVDPTGPHLFDVSANGTTMNRPFGADGSGSYAAITVLERDFRKDMPLDQAKAMVARALQAGMAGDNASGNSYNLVVINKDGAHFEGPHVPKFCETGAPAELEYKFVPNSTTVLKQAQPVSFNVVEQMEIS